MTARYRLGLLVALVFLTGCATHVRVMPNSHLSSSGKPDSSRIARHPWWRADPTHSALVRGHHLEKLIRKKPDLALQLLNEAVEKSAKFDEIAALAGLTLRYGQELERTQPEKAVSLYMMVAALAYRHLATVEGSSSINPLDSQMVQTYNKATLLVVMLLQMLPGGMRTNHLLSACEQSFQVEAQAGDSVASPHYYDLWLAADHWKQRGLDHHYQSDGFGARLIAIRTNRQASPLEARLPDEGIFHPSTAILRFQTTAHRREGHPQETKLVFYHPKFTPQIEIGGKPWPLAADYTIPGAMLLSRTRPLFKTRWSALMHPGETSRPHRLYLFEPYSQDRIPIIMVHGLRSTPLAWQKLTNELMGDPEIRSRYQIWHYLYPTGLPFLTSAANFRDELESVRRMLDPEGRDFATQNMIVIAHSMGGLLAHTLVSDSGDALWDSTFAIPISEIEPDTKELPQLRRMFYFESKPYVKRVIFIAVPHRGSRRADGLLGRIVSQKVDLPNNLHEFVSNLLSSVPGLLKPEAIPVFNRGYPDSIRVLSPQTPSLIALADLPIDSAVPFHSIIGDRGLGGGERSSDGVVPYSSSHLPGATSEAIVPANHRTHESPDAIAEVKRILALHVAEPMQPEAGARSAGVGESGR